MKHIIFNSDSTAFDFDETKEEMSEVNEMPVEDISEEAVWDYINHSIENWYDDERGNLNRELDGFVVCIADLGLWDGRRSAYRLLDRNLNSILSYKGDTYEVFVEDGEVKANDIHHDGVNHYVWRVLKKGVSEEETNNLLDSIVEGDAEEKIQELTDSLAPYVQEIYGFKD
jgi:hypothetical protein